MKLIQIISKKNREYTKNNTSILKTQQIFEIEGHVFTVEINDDKRMQSVYSLERSSNQKRRNQM